ncbi:ANTAR domain-containing protein [Streptomyces minutiscleroticus]|uniref:GAF domain-containing protein n=1 Tax=Streptomyces minutiscleroticus TaxID=68238 RepID=A0A918NP20_9ACTN|nr:ANTAR domain-containing protein [Streptomyces minutiscleroticus]GGX84120.1 GAF domain-containing protein [Streptomyces minutiscleroticus]
MASRGDLAAVLGDLRSSASAAGLIGADAAACARALAVDGVAVSVVVGDGLCELVWSTPGASRHLEDLQFTLGEGPGPEAAATCGVVLEPDLTRVRDGRWPALLPEAVALGVGAVFCFPLLLGGACIGTLTLQRAAPGPPADAAVADAWMVAGALTAVLVENAGRWPASVEEKESVLYRAVVHQAAGMISVQARVTLAQALVRLRAYAFRHGRSVAEVAEDVVTRRVHFRIDQDERGASDRWRD